MTISNTVRSYTHSDVRALFTIAGRAYSFQLLANGGRVVRDDWSWHYSLGVFTLTLVTL